MQKKFDIAVIGDVNPDLILTGKNIIPEFGQVEKWIDDAELTIGGSAGIFAVGAAKLGLKVTFIGKVGDDHFGYFMKDRMTAQGIDVSGLVIDPSVKTGLSISLSDGNDRAILTFGGSNLLLNFQDIDFEIVAQSRHLHSGSFYLLNNIRQDLAIIYKKAKEMGLSTSIDTNYDPKEKWEDDIFNVLDYTDVFLPNMTELMAISGEKDPDSAIRHLTENRNLLVAVKNGEDGAFAEKDKVRYSAETIQVKPIDTTGAGDSFDAGFLFGFLNGLGIEKSLRIGCICGALSTLGIGGTSTQAGREDLTKFGL
ncbi:MAG TPA: carbohydrate kinase family protein [Flexilinea sp.]|nr:carbohydrate kinase family protein [Flexilinea sp.]